MDHFVFSPDCPECVERRKGKKDEQTGRTDQVLPRISTSGEDQEERCALGGKKRNRRPAVSVRHPRSRAKDHSQDEQSQGHDSIMAAAATVYALSWTTGHSAPAKKNPANTAPTANANHAAKVSFLRNTAAPA